jgi:DNA-binding IclR family transcriptional regulator
MGNEPGEPRVLQSAEHALRLVMLVSQRGKLRVSEAAAELDVAQSTAHRLLNTCKHAGFLSQPQPGGPYVIGDAVYELALTTSAAVTLRDAASPVLRDLHQELGETVSLLILRGNKVRFAESIDGTHPLRVANRTGVVVPAHCTSGGKAMLACLTPEQLEARYRSRFLEGVSERSIRDWGALVKELDRVRKRGWAANFGESDPGIAGVGAAVRSGTGDPIAAVTVAAPMSRLSTGPEATALAPAVQRAAFRIQQRIRGGVET